MHTYIALHKPFGVLSQFTGESGQRTLSEFNLPKGVYAAGRLDKDSEGLLLLTDDGHFKARLLHPKSHHKKVYWVQVEGQITQDALSVLSKGVRIKGHLTKPCETRLLPDPNWPERVPPIRERKSIPTSWLEIVLTEGKNRQVRRMTAKVGFPTLRLIRVGIEALRLNDLMPGEWRSVSQIEIFSRG